MALPLVASAPAAAQDVTLSSRDGALSVSGRFLSYDGEYFKVETQYGVLTLDGTDVVCTGPGCPELTAYIARFDLYADAPLARGLAPALLTGFAQDAGYRLSQRIELGVGVRYVLDEPDAARTVAEFRLRRGWPDADAGDAGPIPLWLTQESAGDVLGNAARRAALDALPRAEVVALDALVFAAAPDWPATPLGTDALAALFSSDTPNWQVLDGPDLALDLLLPEAGTSAAARLAAWARSDLGLATLPEAQRAGGPVGPTDFGALSRAALGNARPRAIEGACGAAVSPGDAAIRSAEYPLVLPVFLNRGDGRLPRVGREFLAYLRSDAARGAIRAAGFVDQGLEETPLSAQGDRLAGAVLRGVPEAGLEAVQRFVATLAGHARLSLAFRFEDGSARLDPQSETNVRRLADAIDQGAFDGRAILFAGFSDGVGEGAANMRLSQRRAARVRDAVAAALTPGAQNPPRLAADGFGEAVPIACDDTRANRRINRRVEVWVSQR